jgi:hypothetical protein
MIPTASIRNHNLNPNPNLGEPKGIRIWIRIKIKARRTRGSRIAPLNWPNARVCSLSSSGGEGWGEEAFSARRLQRFMGRSRAKSLFCLQPASGILTH